MPGDLVGGRYPLIYAVNAALGLQSNASQANVPVRSNAEYLGLTAAADTAAALTTDQATAVAVPCDPGYVISKVTVRTGATAAGTPTHSFAALYVGSSGATAPALIKQTADGTSAAIAATTSFQFSLATPYTVQASDVPNGFIYVSISETATTVSSLATVGVPATALTADTTHPWFTGAPIWAQKHGSSLAGVAPATITGGTLVANAPLVFLS